MPALSSLSWITLTRLHPIRSSTSVTIPFLAPSQRHPGKRRKKKFLGSFLLSSFDSHRSLCFELPRWSKYGPWRPSVRSLALNSSLVAKGQRLLSGFGYHRSEREDRQVILCLFPIGHGGVWRIRGTCCNRYLSDCPAVLKHAAPLKRLEPREGTLALIPCFEGSAPPHAPLILAPSVAGGYLVSGPCVRGACGYTGGGWRVCVCLRLRWKARRGLYCCVTDSQLSEEIRRYIVGSVAHFHLRAAPPAVKGRHCAGEGELKPAAQGLQLPCSLCFTNDPKCRCHVTDALQAHQVLIVRREQPQKDCIC